MPVNIPIRNFSVVIIVWHRATNDRSVNDCTMISVKTARFHVVVRIIENNMAICTAKAERADRSSA
jgi:hypothetical protein